jgi:cytoskeletal protein RodZ
MHAKPQSAKLDVRLLITALLFSVSLSAQQQVSQSSSQPVQQSSPPSGVRIDPSAGPLQPNEPPPAATQPAEAPSAQPPVTSVPAQAQAPEQPAPQTPVGAAAAEQVKTAGGGASRPAGSAIAPVKQHQYRSILIKLGAVAAAGIAVGTVYGLSHATPSTPPHAATAATR